MSAPSPPPPEQEEDKINEAFLGNLWENVVSARMLEVSVLGVGTVLRLERDGIA